MQIEVPNTMSWTIDALGSPLVPSPLASLSFVQEDAPSSKTLVPPDHLQRAGPRSKIFFEPCQTIAGIVTCGGICPALNDVIRALVNTLYYKYGVQRVVGFKYGYEGLNPATSSLVDLSPHSVRDIHRLGGTILGSSRGPQPVPVMVDYLVELGIHILFTIGGDGTLKGAHAIQKEIEARGLKISIIGLPKVNSSLNSKTKTIDNDIAYISKTFGFDTAVEMAQAPIMAAHEEARSARNGIGIVKLMGRESGFIALNAALASGDVNLLLIPEMKFSFDEILKYALKTTHDQATFSNVLKILRIVSLS